MGTSLIYKSGYKAMITGLRVNGDPRPLHRLITPASLTLRSMCAASLKNSHMFHPHGVLTSHGQV